MTTIKPTQRDRDAAAAFSATVVGCSMSEPQIADCIAGKQDDTLIVQSYARHAAAERALERAAIVEWLRVQQHGRTSDNYPGYYARQIEQRFGKDA